MECNETKYFILVYIPLDHASAEFREKKTISIKLALTQDFLNTVKKQILVLFILKQNNALKRTLRQNMACIDKQMVPSIVSFSSRINTLPFSQLMYMKL